MKILIAEDDPISGLRLRRSLEKLGHQVDLVGDGGEAWRRIRDGEVPLLISDWVMPELDGLELCRRIRARKDALYTYVVMLTSRNSPEDRIQGLDAGADDFLLKPFDGAELLARLNVARRILSMQHELRTHAGELENLRAALERQNVLLAERAVTDALTGVANRRSFDEQLESALAFARRYKQPLSLILLDVDHFKKFNDSFGHQAGDEVLRLVAAALSAAVRSSDVIARYGGEEFALILPGTAADSALLVAERKRSTVAAGPWTRRPVTASFGVSSLSPKICTVAELIEEADKALYSAKHAGRNRVVHFEEIAAGPVEAAASASDRVESPGSFRR